MQSLDKGPDSIASGNAKAEDVLRDLVTRGGELMQSRERMAGLLEAVVALAEDLSLDAVLERLVQSACSLLQARYGALGVMGEDDTLNHFVTVGIDAEAAARIGRQPTGHGVMGLLVSDPRPLRLHELGRHPEATGFPPNHPPMNTFLGVPIRVRDRVFGNLYLTEKAGGEDFSDEDEALAVALAAAAAVAIENAKLYDDSRRRARWLEACMDVAGLMSAGDRDYSASGLDPIAERARQESASRLALIVAPAESGENHVVVGAAGEQAGEFAGAPLVLDPEDYTVDML